MRLARSNNYGFSAVEALLAATIFGMVVMALIGAFIYSQTSSVGAGDRQRANAIAEEGIEAVRNIRDASFANLADGTYGLGVTGGVWTLTGSSDVTDIYTRQVTISTSSANRKLVTSRVTWAQGSATNQTEATTQFANWSAALQKLWANAIQKGSVDVTGTTAGFKIATQGNYAYLVRNASTANFYVIDISNPASPSVVGTLNVAASPTNIDVVGNYAYITTSSDTAEMQIINITTPTAPTITGSYNAAGNGNGQGVDVVGNVAYLVRASNGASDEFVAINIATPATPTRITGYSQNITMYEVKILGTVAYIATSSDTQELLVINMLLSPILSLGTSVNLAGNADATTIDGYSTTLFIGQGTVLHAATTISLLAPTVLGTITLAGTIYDVSADASHNYAHVGTSGASTEFQVVNMATLSAPILLRSVDIAGSSQVTGVAYNAAGDVTPAAASITTAEVLVFAPN